MFVTGVPSKNSALTLNVTLSPAKSVFLSGVAVILYAGFMYALTVTVCFATISSPLRKVRSYVPGFRLAKDSSPVTALYSEIFNFVSA